MKIICFRFDVDTYLCALKGVPNLIELADKLDVEFTFFFNMGRGASRSAYFKRKRIADNLPHSAKLNNVHKLGIRGFLKTAIINPYVGKSCPGIINTVNGKGHEVGLHGGRNHGAWMANGSGWNERRMNDEVQWGLNELKRAGIQSVTSFSSPGWQGSDTLHKILMDHGIRVVADQHGHDLEDVVPLYDGGLYSVPTNIVGEPGGIGYIENKRALGMSDKDVIEHFRLDLGRITRLAVIYDHPYYSGIKALGLLESMIRVAQELNFTITTMNKLPGLIAS